MLHHTSSHTLSFSLSLSEVRVHPDYSSISCALFLKHSPSHEFKILSETDIVENPGIGGFVTFREESRVEWFLDWEQSIRVELRTFETGLENRSPILVAYTEFRLTQTLVAGKEFHASLRGVNGDECGVLHFNTREIEENRLTLLFKCSTLLSADTSTKKDLLSRLLHKEEVRENRNPHLYLELAVKSQTGVMQTLVTSEEREFAERIDWDMIHIPNIKDINLDKPVWIRLCDRDSAMKVSQTCDELRSLLTDCEHDSKKIKLDPIQSEKRTQPSQLSSSILISACRLIKLPTCVDYLLGGHGLGLTIAVDFTVSNGDHILPTSYHNLSPANDNMYMECIKSALHFIKQYSTLADSGTPVVAYGFGAVPAHLQQMSFCFALNQEEHNPLIQDSDGLLAHYANVVRTATASGPTSLRHVVDRCLHDVMAQESYRQYRVCSVLVAGAVRDLHQVRELIAESARYPVSFVIIGIGNQMGLSEMEKCFREDVKLTSANGARAVRSNVVYRHWKTVKLATQQRGQAVYSSFILTLTSKIMQQFREYYHLMNIIPPTPVNNKTSPEMPYRSLAKQTSLYGQYAAADVSDIKAFQESQLLATPSPYGPVKKESSIGGSLQDAPPSLDASLIKPITLSYADPPGTPLTPEETLLQYTTFATPLSGGRDGRYSPLIHPSTPLIHPPYYDKKPSFHIED